MTVLHGRGIVITGASRGLGRAIASACVGAGADVLICGRHAEAVASTHEELLSQRLNSAQQVFAEVCDVTRPDQAEAIIAKADNVFSAFTGLINNAGVYGPKGPLESCDWHEWTSAIEVNLFGTVLPLRAALLRFKRTGYGKVLNLSGGGATAPLPRLSAYAASKAAVVRVTETIAHECSMTRIDVNSLAPGALNTQMLDEVLEAGPEVVGESFYQRAVSQKANGGTPLERGAQCAVWAMSAASDGITGRLISAVWDSWETLADRRLEISDTDIYTLRRIVPEDRGHDWGP